MTRQIRCTEPPFLRLEYGEAKGYGWKPDVATPWDGSRAPNRFKGRRAGLVDTRLGQLDMGLEYGGGERAGAALWRALPEDMHFDVVSELGKLGLYKVGQIATRDGACLSQWKRRQVDGVIPDYAGEARWYERVRRARCGETVHVLDPRWRVSSLPLRVGDFVVQTAGADGIGESQVSCKAPGNTMPGTMTKMERGANTFVSLAISVFWISSKCFFVRANLILISGK